MKIGFYPIVCIYDNIPFIEKISDCYFSSNNFPKSFIYITREELNQFIKDNHIKMNDNRNFKLFDERTWKMNFIKKN